MGREDIRRIKSRNYTRACPSGKRRYPARGKAFTEFIRLEEKMFRQGLPPPRDIYRCHLCFGWHISTKGLAMEGGADTNGGEKEEE